ncbi:MAG TPA: serine/threonine-protein kinase [Polyangia bacterium]|jgi:serine/threonine protein kinase/tetratricopeptide (TPR) repeat protein
MGGVNMPTNPDEGPRLARGATVGRYVVLGRVGAGAMGEVYAAYDPELDRKLAIKLLRTTAGPAEQTDDQKARLLREARAIAKLSHPNVVVVHDFGSLDDRVFIAMEFVEGSTVTVWLHAAPRTWREVLKLFIAAGRGLQCAHEQSLLHRDFKPENVMVSRDGQVRVMDFGLVQHMNGPVQAEPPAVGRAAAARLSPDDTLELGPSEAAALRRDVVAARGTPPAGTDLGSALQSRDPVGADPSGFLLLGRLTDTGALVGTPAYMAPEQFRGQPLDARSDQFSFCVALHESLYGEHPYGGASITELATNIVQGDSRAPPPNTAVPTWIRRVIRKGLARSPDERYPSMKDLLAALERRPRSRRRQILAGALAALALVGIAASVRSTVLRQRAVCQVPAARFDGVWERASGVSLRRAAIRTAFLHTGKDYADAAFGAAASLLDKYVADWSATFREACIATRVRGSETAEVLDLRMRCLDDRFDELRALSDVLASPSGDVVENAVQAAMSLSPLERCTSTKLSRATLPIPASPATAAAIQVVRADLVAAKALEDAGKSSQAIAALFEVVANARDTGYRPLLAEALYQLGVSTSQADNRAAEPLLIEAVTEAQACRDDDVLIEAMIALISVRGEGAHDIAGAELWRRLAGASLERIGGNDHLRARAQANWAAALASAGRFEDALKAYEQALADTRRALGPAHLEVGLTLAAIANVQYKLGDFSAALAVCDRALAITEAALGPKHPRLGHLLVDRSEILAGLGRYREAKHDAERSYDLWTRNLGSSDHLSDHASLAIPLAALGLADLGLGDSSRAVPALREALARGEAGIPAVAVRFALARALWASPRSRVEAVALAGLARAEARRIARPTSRDRALQAEIERWCDERARQPAVGESRLVEAERPPPAGP